MSPVIRLATPDDAEPLRRIYAPVVRDTATSFELEPPTADEMRRRVAEALARLPWLVCEAGGLVLGYAYAGPHRSRAAYQWSVDVSVYVHPARHRAGVGRALYTSLLRILALQGLYTAYAGITLPNPASVGLHEALGFRPVGVYRGVGYKLGAWRDVGWWALQVRERLGPPEPLLALGAVQRSEGWEAALAAGLPWLRLAALGAARPSGAAGLP